MFIRPHLDYGDEIYDQSNNNGLSGKTGSIQYNVALPITGSIRGTSKMKLYQELGLDLWKTRWLTRLLYLRKVWSTKLLTYLYELTSHRNTGCYKALYCRTDLFWNSFLHFSINEWIKLDPNIRPLDSHAMLGKKRVTFIRLSKKSIYNINALTQKDLNFSIDWD